MLEQALVKEKGVGIQYKWLGMVIRLRVRISGVRHKYRDNKVNSLMSVTTFQYLFYGHETRLELQSPDFGLV